MTSETNVEQYDYYYDDSSERYVTQTLSAFFLVMGSVGNLLGAVVLYRLSREVISTCLYMVALCITDLLILYTRCGNSWLNSVAQVDLSNVLMMSSRSLCKAYPFAFSFLFHLMRWLVVCVAVEGVIATKFPHKVQRMCTTSKAEAVMLLLTVLLICINIQFFWTFELVDTDNELDLMPGVMCTFNRHGHQSSEVFTNVIWPIIDTLVTDGIPSVVISICVIIMLVQISRGRHRGDNVHQAWRERYQMDPLAMDQLKVTFVVVCILYIPATLPKLAVNLVAYLFAENQPMAPNISNEDYEEFMTKRNLANSVFTNVEYAYLSLKFYLYFASSRRFRQEVKKLIKCSYCSRKMSGQKLKHTESMANEPLVNQDGCQRSNTNNSLHREPPI